MTRALFFMIVARTVPLSRTTVLPLLISTTSGPVSVPPPGRFAQAKAGAKPISKLRQADTLDLGTDLRLGWFMSARLGNVHNPEVTARLKKPEVAATLPCSAGSPCV